MNKIFIFLLVFAIFISVSDSALTKEKEPYIFEAVKEVALTKAEIISYANAFIAEKFVSAKSVIQMNDPNLGKIVGDVALINPKAKFGHAFKGIRGRFVLDAKDGKFRLQMSNIVGTDNNGVEKAWGKLEGANRYRIEPMAVSILENFTTELQKYLNNAKANDNW